MAEHPIGRIRVADLAEGEARTFAYLDSVGLREQAVVVRHDGEIYAYTSRCPHWQVPLGVGDLLDRRAGELVCQNHGARFDVRTGRCVAGPPEGGRLHPVPFRIEGDELVALAEDEEWEDS